MNCTNSRPAGEDLEAEIAQQMQPYAEQVAALDTIPGVDVIVAWHLIAELGADMSVFPTLTAPVGQG